MSSLIRLTKDGAVAVYDDRLRPILEALGDIEVERASEVEFDPESGDWVATRAGTGKEIARGKNRSEVIAAEVRWLESEVIR